LVPAAQNPLISSFFPQERTKNYQVSLDSVDVRLATRTMKGKPWNFRKPCRAGDLRDS
jgi:hypothetical protein